MHNSISWRLILAACAVVLSLRVQSKVVDVQTSDQCLRLLSDCATKEQVQCSIQCADILTTSAPDLGRSEQLAGNVVEQIAPEFISSRVLQADLGEPFQTEYARLSTETSNVLDIITRGALPDGEDQENVMSAQKSCKRVCVDNRIQHCITKNICHEPIKLIERWNVTHYCLANDGNRGGWGFRLPLAVSLNLRSIERILFTSEIFPATDPHHISEAPTLELVFALSEDVVNQNEESILKKCDIESIPGDKIIGSLKPSGKSDNSKILSFEVTQTDLVNNRLNANPEPIMGDALLVTIVGSINVIANGGLVPPPFDDTKMEITHVIN